MEVNYNTKKFWGGQGYGLMKSTIHHWSLLLKMLVEHPALAFYSLLMCSSVCRDTQKLLFSCVVCLCLLVFSGARFFALCVYICQSGEKIISFFALKLQCIELSSVRNHVCTNNFKQSWPSICKWMCLHVCVIKGGVSQQQMLVFCQNNLVGIFMSSTRPQLGYRWGEGERVNGCGLGLSKSGTPDPSRTKPCSRPKTARETYRHSKVGSGWTQQLYKLLCSSAYTVCPV